MAQGQIRSGGVPKKGDLDTGHRLYMPWWSLGSLPGYEEGMMQPGPEFAGGQYNYPYEAGYVSPEAGTFGWEDLWGPMSQEMEAQSLAQMANIREQAGMEGGKFSSAHLLAQQAAANQSAKDMNRVMSELQYQDRLAADERQRQLMMDMAGLGGQQEQVAAEDLAMAYQDWLRRSNYGMDMAAMFLGQGYKPDTYMKPPKQDNTGAYAAAIASIIGAIAASSDFALKANFEDVDERKVLESVKRIEIKKWDYTHEALPRGRHIGPTAQDFKKEFGVGDDDRLIQNVDAQGIAFAAIKALAQKVDELERKISERE